VQAQAAQAVAAQQAAAAHAAAVAQLQQQQQQHQHQLDLFGSSASGGNKGLVGGEPPAAPAILQLSATAGLGSSSCSGAVADANMIESPHRASSPTSPEALAAAKGARYDSSSAAYAELAARAAYEQGRYDAPLFENGSLQSLYNPSMYEGGYDSSLFGSPFDPGLFQGPDGSGHPRQQHPFVHPSQAAQASGGFPWTPSLGLQHEAQARSLQQQAAAMAAAVAHAQAAAHQAASGPPQHSAGSSAAVAPDMAISTQSPAVSSGAPANTMKAPSSPGVGPSTSPAGLLVGPGGVPPSMLAKAAEDDGGGMELLQALFPNTRISVRNQQLNQPPGRHPMQPPHAGLDPLAALGGGFGGLGAGEAASVQAQQAQLLAAAAQQQARSLASGRGHHGAGQSQSVAAAVAAQAQAQAHAHAIQAQAHAVAQAQAAQAHAALSGGCGGRQASAQWTPSLRDPSLGSGAVPGMMGGPLHVPPGATAEDYYRHMQRAASGVTAEQLRLHAAAQAALGGGAPYANDKGGGRKAGGQDRRGGGKGRDRRNSGGNAA